MNPKTLRASLPAFDRFELPKTKTVNNYLQHYPINVVATGEAIQQTIGHIHCGAYTLVGQAFFAANARGNALVIHGYMDHTGLYGKLIRHLLRQGLNVYMVDLPGHGLSSGQQASINSFNEYSEAITTFHRSALNQCAAGPWYLFGQSMGGAVAMSILQQRQLNIAKAVLLAPLVQPRAWSLLKFVHSLLKHLINAIPRRFPQNSHDPVFTQFIKHSDTLQTRSTPIAWLNAMRSWRAQFLLQPHCKVPVLVIQGNDDKTIDWRYGNRQIEDLFPNSQRLMVDGARHHLVNEAELYLQQVFDAIDGYL